MAIEGVPRKDQLESLGKLHPESRKLKSEDRLEFPATFATNMAEKLNIILQPRQEQVVTDKGGNITKVSKQPIDLQFFDYRAIIWSKSKVILAMQSEHFGDVEKGAVFGPDLEGATEFWSQLGYITVEKEVVSRKVLVMKDKSGAAEVIPGGTGTMQHSTGQPDVVADPEFTHYYCQRPPVEGVSYKDMKCNTLRSAGKPGVVVVKFENGDKVEVRVAALRKLG